MWSAPIWICSLWQTFDLQKKHAVSNATGVWRGRSNPGHPTGREPIGKRRIIWLDRAEGDASDRPSRPMPIRLGGTDELRPTSVCHWLSPCEGTFDVIVRFNA